MAVRSCKDIAFTILYLLTYRNVFSYACEEELCGAHLFFGISINSCGSECDHFSRHCCIQAWQVCLLFPCYTLKLWNGWFFQYQLQIKQLSPTYVPITQHNTLWEKKLSLLMQGKIIQLTLNGVL